MSDTVKTRKLPMLVCLALILAFPFASSQLEAAVGILAPRIGEVEARVATEAAIWASGTIILCLSLFGEPRSLASIGLKRPTLLTPLWGLLAAMGLILLGAVASFVTYNVLHEANHAPAQIEALVRGSVPYALCMALRAGVVEEVLYRGLAIEQLTVLVKNRWLAALIATAAFVAIHLVHFDPAQLIPIATASTGLAVLYLWRRNLWINITAHFLIDALALSVVAMKATNLY